MNGRRGRIFVRQDAIQSRVYSRTVFLEKGWEFHRAAGLLKMGSWQARLAFFPILGLEGFHGHFTTGLLQQDLDLALCLFEVLLAIAR